ncbi:MAG TPA: hypothetical protein VJ456_08570, partial [Acidimicrobiia bacterium]|nr:hypothetical protein [Acidimicrobiia bacterium]
VPGDTNGALDVFVYDRQQSTITRVSVADDGSQANGDSRSPSIDDTGTVIAFTSSATNLVPGDTNGKPDVFVRTIGTNPSTQLVSVATGGSPGNDASDVPSLNTMGTQVAFSSDATDLVTKDTNGKTDVFLRDLTAKTTELVSVKNGGSSVQGNGDSFSPSISGDGDQIAFASDATNLLSNSGTDDNDATDVYLRTRSASTIQLVSRSCGDQIGDQQSYAPRITSDTASTAAGVSFVTDATNLLQGCSGSPAPDNNNATDVYFRTLRGTPEVTERVSIDTTGAQFPRPSLESAVSGDGLTMAFATGSPDVATGGPGPGAEVYKRDRSSTPAATTRLSAPLNGTALGPAETGFPAISGDGNTVAYVSAASDLVTDDSNGVSDVFVYDRAKNVTSRVSLGMSGAQANGPSGTDSAPALSADGRIVAFTSDASNLVPGDTNGQGDVFVFDRATKETTRVSVGPGGAQADDASFSPSLSADGAVLAFISRATNLTSGDNGGGENVFVRDLKAGTTTKVTRSGSASSPSLSADGKAVAFASAGTDLVPGDTNGQRDVFVFDRVAGSTERVSVGPGGAQGDHDSTAPSLSGDGRFVAFASDATDLVPADTNQRTDIFVRDRRLGTTTRVSLGPTGQADRASTLPSISADGRYVAFQSAADNLVAGDTNSAPDIFVHDRTPVRGYWLAASDGGIFAYGSAAFAGSTGAIRLAKPIVAMAPSPTGKGYWLTAADGGVFSFGDAAFAGSTGSIKLAQPIAGMAANPAGKGYWLVASDGGVFAFGDAAFFGSTGKLKLAQPIVGMAPTPTGRGYWLVARDGGIFAFGDATFFGSTGAMRLAQPIVGMAPTPAGGGYWLVGADGGIFAFGEAAFFGSTGAMKLNKPIVGLSPSPTGAGYWLVASDGGIFSFGDAAFFGSAGAVKLVKPIVGMAARP